MNYMLTSARISEDHMQGRQDGQRVPLFCAHVPRPTGGLVNAWSSEIDLVVRQSPRGHTLAQASAREGSLASPVQAAHAILEEFFLSDQSNLIRSYPCRPMHVVSHSVRHCAASLGAYATNTMHKLFSAPRLLNTPVRQFCHTSRTDEGTRQRHGLHPPNTMHMCHTRALRHAQNPV